MHITRILIQFRGDAKLMLQDPELKTSADFWGFSNDFFWRCLTQKYRYGLLNIIYT